MRITERSLLRAAIEALDARIHLAYLEIVQLQRMRADRASKLRELDKEYADRGHRPLPKR